LVAVIKVGLTGGIGTGKATVAKMLSSLGALVIDADRLAHEAVHPGSRPWKQVVRAFGKGILGRDGRIDRRRLAAIVFSDPGKLRLLDSIVHPPVLREMRRRMERAAAEGRYPVAVADVPLLFEAGLENEFDRVIVVTCPREEQIRRCRARGGMSREEVERRINAQMPLREKERRADYVIDNRGALEQTGKQVREVWERVVSGSGA
jgi:dephospho-CoA kinase